MIYNTIGTERMELRLFSNKHLQIDTLGHCDGALEYELSNIPHSIRAYRYVPDYIRLISLAFEIT